MALTKVTGQVLSNNLSISGIATASNFKTGTTNVHATGVEASGINVTGGDTSIGTGATVYKDGSIRSTGIVTATTFSGGAGGLTGALPAIDGSALIGVASTEYIHSSTNAVLSGIVTTGPLNSSTANFSSNVTVSGNLGVAGTVTYEDVKNVDSVGLITARTGIKIGPSAGVGGTFFADGSYETAGIITAITYKGSGSDLTGINAGQLSGGTLADARFPANLPVIGGANITGIPTTGDINRLETNIAILGFKIASNNDLNKYNLQDQFIDEFEDTSGVDAGASTNETLSGGAYSGTSTAAVTPTVSGGTVSTDGDYKVHQFTATGTYNSNTTQAIDIMVVAGGGTGGRHGGAGGGAGGMVYATGYTLASGAHTVTVGDGGTSQWVGDPGDDSSVGSLLTAKGGGQGRREGSPTADSTPYAGGCAAGTPRTSPRLSGTQPSQAGVSGSSGFGTNGGLGTWNNGDWACGGGGGIGQQGGDGSGSTAGNGGNGKAVSITGSSVTYGGGGGGGVHYGGTHNGGSGGSGGGGAAGTSQFANGAAATGYGSGGGGGAKDSTGNGGGAGSKGIVVFRRKTTFNQTTYVNMTLQSTTHTADSTPTKADVVIMIEDVAGTATLNTDIKAYISRNGSAFTSAVTLVNEASWGANKKVLTAHDVDLSGITAGTSMKWKIETLNQSAAKRTSIHAVSLGWK